jgi:hypothetical protein
MTKIAHINQKNEESVRLFTIKKTNTANNIPAIAEGNLDDRSLIQKNLYESEIRCVCGHALV